MFRTEDKPLAEGFAESWLALVDCSVASSSPPTATVIEVVSVEGEQLAKIAVKLKVASVVKVVNTRLFLFVIIGVSLWLIHQAIKGYRTIRSAPTYIQRWLLAARHCKQHKAP